MKYIMKLIQLHKRNVINNTQTLFPVLFPGLSFGSNYPTFYKVLLSHMYAALNNSLFIFEFSKNDIILF